MKKISIILLIFIATIASCTNTQAPPILAATCNTSVTPFNTLYNALKTSTSPSYTELSFFNSRRREYEFVLTGGDTKICSIGYQAEAGIPTGTYRISIIDESLPIPLFDGNLSFNSTSMSYVSIGPVQLQLNKPYLLRRDIVNDGGNANNTTGAVLIGAGVPLPLPLINGNLKITKTNFSGLPAGNSTNTYLPNIDFSVQP
jgi:hypothetical protein